VEEFKKILPFTIYDFFGYLFPATIFITLSVFVIITAHPELITALKPVLEQFEPLFSGNAGIISTIFLVLFSISSLYFFGHAIGAISHLFYDRIIVKNIFGYPIESLLGVPQRRKRTVEATYFYIVTLVVVMMFSVLIDRFLNYDVIKFFLTFVFSWGWKILAFISLIVLILNREFYEKVGNWELKSQRRIWFERLSNAYYWPYKTAQYFIISPLFSVFACTDKMPEIVKAKFFDKITKQLEIKETEVNLANTEIYWLPIFDIYSKNNIWKEKIENWMNLYGFMRNLSTAGYLLCIEIALILSHNATARFGLASNKAILISIYYGMLLISILIGIRYWIFYRNYYSKNIIRGYIYNKALTRGSADLAPHLIRRAPGCNSL